ncbi:hypothetical protein BDQ17DRAFT_1427498 [Cyathus striatus]|nr:hypothetical protein BDQ17DRAFT_1427498 [Cyathus striatus]
MANIHEYFVNFGHNIQLRHENIEAHPKPNDLIVLNMNVAESQEQVSVGTAKDAPVAFLLDQLCPGVLVVFPTNQSPHIMYPYGLHAGNGDKWNYAVMNGSMRVYTQTCSRFAINTAACYPCRAIEKSDIFQHVLEQIEDSVHENAKLVYHGIGGLIEIAHHKTKQNDTLQFQKLNDAKKLAGKVVALDQHKALILAIASGSIKRVDCVIKAALDRKLGVQGILRLYNHAALGLYKPKNYSEEEALLGLLLWHFGGARTAGITHKALDLPSMSTL